jgi:hypothetical protein
MRPRLIQSLFLLGATNVFAETVDFTGIFDRYDYVDPTGIVPDEPLSIALSYYDRFLSSFPNKNFITVIDFSVHSGQRRFFVIDMRDGSVEALHTSHGKGSDTNNDGVAERFSNVPESHTSSLGFYRTAETYEGSNGYSLKLDGLSETNSNARRRAIVVHGASYVSPSRSQMGRSLGCPALSTSNNRRIINKIKGGSLMYAWDR